MDLYALLAPFLVRGNVGGRRTVSPLAGPSPDAVRGTPTTVPIWPGVTDPSGSRLWATRAARRTTAPEPPEPLPGYTGTPPLRTVTTR